MQYVTIKLDVDTVLSEDGNFDTLIWFGDDTDDPKVISHTIDDMIQSMLKDYQYPSGRFNDDDATALKLLLSAFENNVHMAVDAARFMLDKKT